MSVYLAVLVLGGVGLFFSLLLSFLNKKLKVEEDPRIKEILEVLPQINCGACGFSGCLAYAQNVVKYCSIFKGCLPGGEEVNKKVSKILGIECSFKKEKVVVCRCGAEEKEKTKSSIYQGIKTCRGASLIGGRIDCLYGCLGFGDCVKVCPVGAITLGERIYVDIKKCIGCGKCVNTCPRSLFEFVPLREKIYYVACSNHDKGIDTKKVCKRGCIGCGICTRTDNNFYLKDNLSYLNYENIEDSSSCEKAKNKCPTKCIFLTN
jgi:RnfABCDGE-type electron transport complex B subunit